MTFSSGVVQDKNVIGSGSVCELRCEPGLEFREQTNKQTNKNKQTKTYKQKHANKQTADFIVIGSGSVCELRCEPGLELRGSFSRRTTQRTLSSASGSFPSTLISH